MSKNKPMTAAEMGRKGGTQRAKNLTAEQIREISRKAGLASAEKRKQAKLQEENNNEQPTR